jgi:hypothetical protein
MTDKKTIGEKKRDEEQTINYYIKKLTTFTTDKDIKTYMNGENKIIKYSDLDEYNNINDLLTFDKDYRFILLETTGRNTGHWTCIMRYNNTIEYFDSYGVRPDGEFIYISKYIQKILGQDKRTLKNLMKTDLNLNSIYNKIKFQQNIEEISTCGRHCILRVSLMKYGYTLEQYINFMTKQKKEYDKPYDILVCDWISLY